MADDKKIKEVYAVEYDTSVDALPVQNQPQGKTSRIVKNYSDDPEVAAMTTSQLAKSIFSLAGKWANRDDINEDWLDNIRNNWDKSLNDEIYKPQQ